MTNQRTKSLIVFLAVSLIFTSLSLTPFGTLQAGGEYSPIRGIVKIKPVYIGITYYFPWSYPNAPLTMQEAEKSAQEMVERFKENLEVDFVEVEAPLIIKEHADFRKLKAELSYDTDALLVGGSRTPL